MGSTTAKLTESSISSSDVDTVDEKNGISTSNGTPGLPGIKEVTNYDDYEPPPLIPRSIVIGCGLVLFVLAMIWPPLILVVTYIASRLIPYSYRINDDATTRRLLMTEFEKGDAFSVERQNASQKDGVVVSHSYWMNPRGLLLHTNVMTPKDPNDVQAVICFCHGYVDNPSYTKLKELTYLVRKAGLAIIMVEYEGHGKSDGNLALIKDWDLLMNDAHLYFQETLAKSFPGKKAFLMGESLGGAVAYTIIHQHPESYSGVVFVCPMCKIADEMMPPDFVVDMCRKIAGPTGTASALGYMPIAPSKGDLIKYSFKLDKKREIMTRHPAVFKRNPRLATAREMLDVTKRISESLGDFEAPFLVQHGLADRVTDPKLSQELYDEARSKDKSIRLYDGMWHALTNGEPDENIQKVYDDSIEWILERAGTENDKKTK